MLDVGKMSAQLALDLDHDAIRLLSRQSDGWVVEGIAELDSADLTQKIAGLRQRAEDLAGPDPAVLLVLPRSQVLYVSFDELEDPESEIPRRLDGLTPYQLSEMTWDHVSADGRTDVAAVALETIDEALAFATSSRFRVVGLTSEPPEGEFPRLPVFQRLPAFLRTGEVARPLLLEPAEPPERAAVAFSEQREASYTPARVPFSVAAAARAKRATAGLPDRAREILSLIPKPLLGAIAVGTAVILGTTFWPQGDPDPFTKRNVDLSFSELPSDSVEGLAPPDAQPAPAFLSGLDPVTVLRDPPVIVVPVVIGASGVEADYRAVLTAEGAFERFAALPALYGETRLPAAQAVRPSVLVRPDFPAAEAPARSRVSRADAPAPLAPPPAATPAPTIAAVAASGISRLPGSLPAETGVPAPPAAATPLDRPRTVVEAPAETVAPPAEPPSAAPVIPPYPDPEAPADFASLPPQSGLAASPPDAAMARLPPADGESFELGPDGFVVATPEGAETPGGALAIAGAPPLVAPPRPGTGESEAATEQADGNETAEAATDETAPLDPAGVTPANPNPELAAFRPRPRPAVAVADAGPSTEPAAQVPDALIAESLAPPEAAEPTEPVLTVSLVPRPRPDRPAVRTATATATRAAPAAPRIPSRANVAREATIEDALPLGSLNLIGVYGSANNRRALVRLPTGRFVKLKVGDRLDGGQVAQIGSDRLLYQKGSRTLALEMPNT